MNKNINLKNIGIFFILFLIFFILIYFNSFSHVRSSITDRFYGYGNVLENIVIVKIDDESINKIGRWPWNRDIFSRILGKVKEAKIVGMDLSFFEESENDESLRKALALIDNVVLAAEINEGVLYKPIFDTNFGYVNLITNSDGVTRGVEPSLRKDILPFAFEIYKNGWNKDAEFSDKPYIINFASKPGSFKSISAVDVLNDNFSFHNKFVLIGATAPNLHDTYFVPTSKGIAMAGVEINANILQNLILNNFLKKQGVVSTILVVFIIGVIGMFIISRLKIYYSIPIIIGIIISYGLVCIFAFNRFDYIFDVFFFPVSLLAFTGTGIGINYLEEKKHSAYLTNAFGKYISKDLLKEIINRKHELKLGGQKRTITILFSDIRGFTTISEKLSPEELVHLLNEYLTEMTRIILEFNGTVDKFIGDAVMAFWNAPLEEKNHAQHACQATIEQIKELQKLQKKWEKEGFPLINIGCGIHTGPAIIGNMGSEDRFDYTAMGDTINIGSRLEGLTKQYDVAIIISETTYKIIKNYFKCRKLDAVKVKGKKLPVVIYELCVDYDEKFSKQYEKALDLYFKSKFKQAIKEFKVAIKLKKNSVSCNLFIERCREYIKNPPGKEWDGAYVMKTK